VENCVVLSQGIKSFGLFWGFYVQYTKKILSFIVC
jgi:hypothetical protein